jgi:transposase
MKRRELKPIKEGDIEALYEGYEKGEKKRYRRRCHAIYLMYSQGKSLNEIVSLFNVDRDTASRWLNRYESEGIGGLKDRPIPGRPLESEEEVAKKI